MVKLSLCASSAGGVGSIPGQGTKIRHAVWQGQKPKQNKKQTTTSLVDLLKPMQQTWGKNEKTKNICMEH